MPKKLFIPIAISIFTLNANAQWVLSNNGLSNTGTFSFAISGTNIFVGTNIGVDLSTNNAANWTSLINGIGPVTSLAIQGNTIFAGTEGDSIYISVNNGSSWTRANNGLTTNAVYALTVDGNNVFAGTESGIFLSADNGASWSPRNSGLTNLDVRAITVDGINMYAGTNGGGVFTSSNNGTSWMPINNGLPAGTWVRSIKISGANIFAATDSGIYLSVNNGSSWSAINSGLTDTNIFSLLIIGQDIIAGSESGGVFKSSNNGTAWTPINTGFPGFGIAFALAANATNIFVTMYSDGVYTRPLNQVTSINEHFYENGFSIFSNPVSDNIIFAFAEPLKIEATIFISDALGRKIGSYQIQAGLSEAKKDISELARGFYLASIKTAEHTVIRKFVKE